MADGKFLESSKELHSEQMYVSWVTLKRNLSTPSEVFKTMNVLPVAPRQVSWGNEGKLQN